MFFSKNIYVYMRSYISCKHKVVNELAIWLDQMFNDVLEVRSSNVTKSKQ